jgi:hypothetical protein
VREAHAAAAEVVEEGRQAPMRCRSPYPVGSQRVDDDDDDVPATRLLHVAAARDHQAGEQ